jgi:protein phosphatase
VTAAPGIANSIIQTLLRPRGWTPPLDRTFMMDVSAIDDLCNQAEALFKQEPTVLRLNAPIKIFGDLHGQYADLMRLFDEYGSPSTSGDISYIDYLFLGDYVDRGSHSLEIIVLLLALKVENPSQVHLIRGNHEASDINAQFGFRLECVERLGDQGLWVWQRFNSLFNWMPLAAVIDGKILCMHGGIGRSMEYISEIEALQRPLTMETGGLLLMDLLWSDPTENDRVEGVHPNARGPGLVSFGPDRVHRYCEVNDLQLIVRAHECVMDGFERFAAGKLITVFSATNYCGTANNAGAILVVGRDLVVVPKLIHPLPPSALTDGEGSPHRLSGDAREPSSAPAWLEQINRERPATPPRGRPPARGTSSLAWI